LTIPPEALWRWWCGRRLGMMHAAPIMMRQRADSCINNGSVAGYGRG